MNCVLRKWRMSDAKDLAAALNNQKIHNNLRVDCRCPIRSRTRQHILPPCSPPMKTAPLPMPSP